MARRTCTCERTGSPITVALIRLAAAGAAIARFHARRAPPAPHNTVAQPGSAAAPYLATQIVAYSLARSLL